MENLDSNGLSSMKEIWSTLDEGYREHIVMLVKLEGGGYELVVENGSACTSAGITLDRKQLKALFHAIGDELIATT